MLEFDIFFLTYSLTYSRDDILLFETETVAWRCLVKKVFLEILQNSQENTCVGVSFLTKLQASALQLYYERDPGTDVFLRI